jgi:signal recognition particle receptor subunit beta
MGSGKTSLFYKLSEDAVVGTVTSTAANVADISIPAGNFRLLDYPGHPRLRPELLQSLRRSPARVAVLVVDGADRGRVKEAAEILSDLFYAEFFRAPVVIAVSKSDAANFRSPGVVAAELEREVDAIRSAREADGLFLGVSGENFKLAKHAPVPVRLCAFALADLKALHVALSKALAN